MAQPAECRSVLLGMDIRRIIEDYRNADVGTRCCMYLWHRELREVFAAIDEEEAVGGDGEVR